MGGLGMGGGGGPSPLILTYLIVYKDAIKRSQTLQRPKLDK